MKGVILNVVEDAVVQGQGEATRDAMLERAGLTGSWTAVGDYPDEELLRLTETGSATLGLEADELTRRLGHDALLGLSGRYAAFFDPRVATTSFCSRSNDVIHPEVRKLHPTARPPWFDFEPTADGALLVDYHSQRRLCTLAHGMIRGAATRFGESATVTHESWAREGAPAAGSRAPSPRRTARARRRRLFAARWRRGDHWARPLVEAVVSQHGGHVHLDPAAGAGTTVTVRLPVDPRRSGVD